MSPFIIINSEGNHPQPSVVMQKTITLTNEKNLANNLLAKVFFISITNIVLKSS